MIWYHYVAYFFGAVFSTNAIPHLVSGVTGRLFQTPFAKPPGRGLSSSTANIVWAFINLVLGYLLIFQIGDFQFRFFGDACAIGLGSFLMALFLSRYFGKFHGGLSAPR